MWWADGPFSAACHSLVDGCGEGVTDDGRCGASGAASHRGAAHVDIDRCPESIRPTLDPRIDPIALRFRPRLSMQHRFSPASKY